MSERVILSGVLLSGISLDEEDDLREFETLAYSAGSVVVDKLFQHRQSFDPATALGQGKVTELAAACEKHHADAILFFNDLTPVQQRNLEKTTGRKTVDRTALILDIFAQRARTGEGKLQVELAQLQYALTHLIGTGNSLSRLGGGIGTRGPGEQKLETDRRRILQRIRKLQQEVEKIKRHRSTLRVGRRRSGIPIVSIIGYTNSGKTSLLNVLTNSDAYVAPKYFATLDPLVRRLSIGDANVLLTDTVGFFHNFPPYLAAAFRATLEELRDADLLLHVVDAFHPQIHKQVAFVGEILSELGLEEKPVVLVMNKIDQITPALKEELKEAFPKAVFTSAQTKAGVKELKERVKNMTSTHSQKKNNAGRTPESENLDQT